jgi:hypothetical protein
MYNQLITYCANNINKNDVNDKPIAPMEASGAGNESFNFISNQN